MAADTGGEAARAGQRNFLHQHRVVEGVATPTAVLRRVLQAEQAVLRHPVEDLVGEPSGVLPVLRVWTELGVDEAADRLPKLLVLVSERRRRLALRRREGGLLERAIGAPRHAAV